MTVPAPPSELPAHEARRLWVVARSADDPVALFRSLEARRLQGHPLQYLEGTAPFGPLDLVVDERVLIPRPETEQLWELAESLTRDPRTILDLGTGSGALALAMASAHPAARVIGVDRSQDALDVAAANARKLGIEVEWRHGDLWSALPSELRGRFDLVVSNPPYLAEHDWMGLSEDVKREPREALVAGPTGLEALDRVAAEVSEWLRVGGAVACEIGETQGSACREMFSRSLDDVAIRRDLAGRDRFVVGRRA